MTAPLIRLDQITFAYPDRPPVLRGCSLELHPGEKIGLTGGNGSGKTTILSLIVGLILPQQGSIEILGKPRRRPHDFDEVLGRVGLLFQNSDDQLFCPTVAEDVAFGPFNQGKSREEVRRLVAETLEHLGLAGMENRITYRLSGGEKRMVALATVLAMQPEVLLLDEPTVGLDEQAARRVREMIARLPQAMIIVSHDRELVDEVAERHLVMDDGQVIARYQPEGDRAAEH